MSEPFVHRVIRASAGSGKTHQLTNRYLALLAAGVAPEEILATTFTRKAAGEILDRVLERLAAAADNDTAANELADQIHAQDYGGADFVKLLRNLLSNLHRVRISTLDSFYVALAGTFSLELGLPAGWSICEPADDDELRQQAVERVLENDDADVLARQYHRLTRGQTTRGVQQTLLKIVADLYEIHQETKPDNWKQVVVGESLTDDELETCLSRIEAFDLSDHSAMSTPRSHNLKRARVEDWKSFVSKGLADKIITGEGAFRNKPIPEQLVELYRPLVVHARHELIRPLAEQTAATRELLDRFHEELWALKQANGQLRFGEVTRALVDGLERDLLSTESLTFRLDGAIEHLLLDEFQDTSLSQWRAVMPIAKRITSAPQPGRESLSRRSFFCVGDVKQAIYGWRGGMAEIFNTLDSTLGDLCEETLVESRRSAQPVIDAVNKVFGHLTAPDKCQAGLEAWSARIQKHTTVKENEPGYACLRTGPAQQEGEGVADQRGRHCAEVATWIKEINAQAPDCSIGVLCRKRETVARLIYELRRVDVTASEEAGNPLTDSPAVELVLSLFTLADHPGHSVAWFHLTNSPLREHLQSFHDADLLSRELRRDLLADGYGRFTQAWAQRVAPACDRRDLSRLQQLVEMAYFFEARSTLRPGDFVAWARQQPVPDPSGANVRVMTIHAAKGLQFDAVVLPELDASLTGKPPAFVVGRDPATLEPNYVCRYVDEKVRALMSADEKAVFDADVQQNVEESLSLLYVAMTRAVHALYLHVPGPRNPRSDKQDGWHKLIQGALAPDKDCAESSLIYETGDPNWFEKRELESPPPTDRERQRPGQILFHTGESARPRGLEHSAPSKREGNAHVALKGLFQPSEGTGMAAGTLYHAWFELIDWLDDGAPTTDDLRNAAERLRVDLPQETLDDLDNLIVNFRAWLDNPAINRVLHRAAYARPQNPGFPQSLAPIWSESLAIQQVDQERPFFVRDGGQFWNGFLDRVVWLADGDRVVAADVLDWKTDAIAPANERALRERVEHYRPQLDVYRRAVAKFARLPASHVATRLVFTFGKKIVELAGSPSPNAPPAS